MGLVKIENTPVYSSVMKLRFFYIFEIIIFMEDTFPPIKPAPPKEIVIPAAHRPLKVILELFLVALFIALLGGGLFLVFQNSISVPKSSIILSPSPETTINPQAEYVCPPTEYLDCSKPEEQDCSVEYVDWAKRNCTNFKGIASPSATPNL